jgi:hypothetical protein
VAYASTMKVGVPPTPRHHAGQFRDEKAVMLEFVAEVIEVAYFKVQVHTIARNGIAWTCLMQSDGTIATGCVHSRINWRAFMAEVFNELESQQILIETKRSIYILNVDRGVVESKFAAGMQIGGSPSRRPALLDSHPLCGARNSGLFRRGFSYRWFLH